MFIRFVIQKKLRILFLHLVPGLLCCFLFTGQKVYSLDPDITVAQDGSGDFTKIQDAINAAPSNSDIPVIIFIKRGHYNTEKLLIPSDKKNICFTGESRDETIISYHIYNCSGGLDGKCPAEDIALWPSVLRITSATLTIQGDGFRAENLTIENTAGPVGQAQAITVEADKVVFVNCNITGYQDTIYLWTAGNRSYFCNCLITGRTDYIYGAGIAFFQACEIRSWGGGWITAPSTPLSQPYGFVFNKCTLTYALNSPRAGDDGEPVRMGRPWHEYPKVAWLYCEMTGMIHPEGWGDTWNMEYAATSTDLHLYEYNNTGEGADMSGRADWAGLRALTDEEALNYTVYNVLEGQDGWDPSADPPLVPTYTWTGAGTTGGWLVAENWNPPAVPSNGEAAIVSGKDTITADGSAFTADLALKDSTVMEITDGSTVSYLSVARCEIYTGENVSLGGKIATKDTFLFNITGSLTLDATLTGIHEITKRGPGTLILNADNINFSGSIVVDEGNLAGAQAGSLGKGTVYVNNDATLTISNAQALWPSSALRVTSGTSLVLNTDATTTGFFIDGVMQALGEYTAVTNPGLISGTGKIIVGRPDTFTFIGGENGNWDVPGHYIPALFPLAGETVLCSREMETTSTVFLADIIMTGSGHLRLRGNHQSTGTIRMKTGTYINYNTSGTGFALDAPIIVEGNVELVMESGNTSGSSMTLGGPVSGASRITVLNNGKGTVNTGTVILTGDNSGFTGTWDLKQYSRKYPSVPGYISCINGQSENAFGSALIDVGLSNKVIFSHARAAGDSLNINLGIDARAVLNTDLTVSTFTLNGTNLGEGTYSASTHPEYFEGTGTITVGSGIPEEDPVPAFPGAEGFGKYTTGGRGGQVYYVTTLEDVTTPGSLRYALNQPGPRIILFKVSGTIQLMSALKITSGNVTIAGQTAPGDGICLRDYPVTVDANNVIIRFMRFRMGDETNQEADALGGRFHKNIIIDHCSMSWSVDECVSFYQNENFTLQWCIISESLRNSVHDKGPHGYGGIWGGRYASFHHNLLAHHDSRNPRLGESAGDAFALTDLVDLRNNVIYNWQGNSCYGGEAMNVNIVNCYYKPGPATTKNERIISIDKNTEAGTAVYNTWGKFFIDGNYMSASTRATNDNWTYGVYNQFNSKYLPVSDEDKAAMHLTEALASGGVTTHTAAVAYENVLKYAGASLARDTVDKRIVHDVRTGSATVMDGGNGSVNGIIDTQAAVGGWPQLNSTTAPTDTDNDGIPDVWETDHGLSPDDPGDAQLKTVDGIYPNVEVYINSIVASIVEKQNEEEPSTYVSPVKEISDKPSLLLNNATGMLRIDHHKPVRLVQIFSVTGILLKTVRCNILSVTIALPESKPGILIVRVTDQEQSVFSQRILCMK